MIDAKPARSDSQEVNKHRWTMFVSLSLQGQADQTSEFIRSVTYKLHPTFRPSVIKIEKAPFLIARVGWGYFTIEVEI